MILYENTSKYCMRMLEENAAIYDSSCVIDLGDFFTGALCVAGIVAILGCLLKVINLD